MSLIKTMKWTIFITILALTYIQLQMKTIYFAYEGKNKEKEIRKLIEENGHLTYTILTLKSSNHLGEKMLSDQSSLQFIDQNNVVKVAANNHLVLDQRLIKENISAKNSNPLLSLLSLGSQAEAKMRE